MNAAGHASCSSRRLRSGNHYPRSGLDTDVESEHRGSVYCSGLHREYFYAWYALVLHDTKIMIAEFGAPSHLMQLARSKDMRIQRNALGVLLRMTHSGARFRPSGFRDRLMVSGSRNEQEASRGGGRCSHLGRIFILATPMCNFTVSLR